MVAMKLWWPPVLQSEPGHLLRCPGSPTFSANQKCSYLTKSTAPPAHKCATSGNPRATSKATHWPVWSGTQLCRVISGSPTSSMCSVGNFISAFMAYSHVNGLIVCINVYLSERTERSEGIWLPTAHSWKAFLSSVDVWFIWSRSPV